MFSDSDKAMGSCLTATAGWGSNRRWQGWIPRWNRNLVLATGIFLPGFLLHPPKTLAD